MLKKVTLTNYRIFKNPTTIEMKTLPLAMIFGPESQGKTSLIAGIHWFIALSLGRQTLKHTMSLSLMGDHPAMSLTFEFVFKEETLTYTLTYNPVTEAAAEVLLVDGNPLFERKQASVSWPLAEAVTLPGDKTLLSHILTDEALSARLNLTPLKQYLENTIYLEPLKEKIYARDKIRLQLEALNAFFEAHQIPLKAAVGDRITGSRYQLKLSGEKKVLLITHLKGGRTLPLTEESLDVRTLVNLLPALFKLKKEPGLLLMDNLSKALHPKTEALVVAWIKKELTATTTIFVSGNPLFLLGKTLPPDNLFVLYNHVTEGGLLKPLSEHAKNNLPKEMLRASDKATIKH